MIDSLILRPLLKIGTWAKRHTAATLIILVLLWLAPPFLSVAYSMITIGMNLIRSFLGATTAAAVARVGSRVWTWFTEAPARLWWVSVVVGFINPLLGAALALWLFLDRYKAPWQPPAQAAFDAGAGKSAPTADDSQTTVTPNPNNSTIIKPDFGDLIDDFSIDAT